MRVHLEQGLLVRGRGVGRPGPRGALPAALDERDAATAADP